MCQPTPPCLFFSKGAVFFQRDQSAVVVMACSAQVYISWPHSTLSGKACFTRRSTVVRCCPAAIPPSCVTSLLSKLAMARMICIVAMRLMVAISPRCSRLVMNGSNFSVAVHSSKRLRAIASTYHLYLLNCPTPWGSGVGAPDGAPW